MALTPKKLLKEVEEMLAAGEAPYEILVAVVTAMRMIQKHESDDRWEQWESIIKKIERAIDTAYKSEL